ncbi:hypothetical protein [Chitinophaga rhizosphaerae]|uniref:hypothetical protein n=1 Tax=Chitinophaga rhizosphaerae TaxID=1864947 RepID=UPI000F80E7C2|nr:hypothetical protein [Chitinophaga rhizosphaerae]
MPQTAKNPWWHKSILSILVALACVNIFSSVFFSRLTMVTSWEGIYTLYKYMYPSLIVLGIVFACGFPFYWQFREKSGKIGSEKVQAVLVAIVRYWLALEISGYGFSKLLGIQFGESFVRNDSIVGGLSGFNLTWNYFGHSYVFSSIIAVVQVAGSVMLLFRRTTLPGVLILLPVMVNIVLIDLFYGIPVPATLNAIYFTVGLAYLFFLHWDIIKPVFTKTLLRPVLVAQPLKLLVRVLVIGCSLGFFMYVNAYLLPKQSIAGKWRVTKTVRNNIEVSGNDWLTDNSAWQNIYIEHYKWITCSPNPFFADVKRSQTGEYAVNPGDNSLTVRMFNPARNLHIHVNHVNNNTMIWKYQIGIDTVQLFLVRSFVASNQ